MSTPNRLPYTFINSPFSTPLRAEPAFEGSPGISSSTQPMTQARLRALKRNKWDKANDILATIQKDFDSLGDFLVHLFHNSARGSDPRSARHVSMVSAFLQGASESHMGEIIELIYHHRQSKPRRGASDLPHIYSPDVPLDEIRHAHPCLSAWAARLIGDEVHKEVGQMTKNDPDDPNDRTQLRATRSSRSQTNVPQVTWEDLGKFSIPALAAKYQKRAPLTSYLMESMAARRKGGKVIVRLRRPHTTVTVGAISAFIFTRNHFANYLALNIGIWQFACKAHIDEKRIFSRFGYAVHDSTVRECLNSLSASSLEALRKSVTEGIEQQGMVTWRYALDNVQRWDAQREQRIGRQGHLKVGTAATAIKLEDYAPGAFDLEPHLKLVMKMERADMTTRSVFHSIDWNHQEEVQALHWVRHLVGFIDELESYRKEVSNLFRGEGIAKHRMREGRKTVVQPLGTNAEKEVETQGMMRAILDFEKQMGLDEKALDGKIIMPTGDGASFAAILRIKKYLAAHPDDYKSFRGRVSIPELWHTRATNLNSIAENHYGPIASPDPSSLSKSAAAVNTKRPSNLKKCDFYPTARSILLFFEARVLDCWRVFYDVDNLAEHFKNLKAEGNLPTLDNLREIARLLVRRYTSQEAYNQALSSQEWDDATDAMKVPKGTPWTAPVNSRGSANSSSATGKPEGDGNIEVELEEDVGEQSAEQGAKATAPEEEQVKGDEKKKVHVEKQGFDGDRVLANAILFLQDAGWWVEASYAVREGDIGRVFEIIKIWIFSFTGTSNRNYSNWLLELYCLFRYESSKDMSDGILNNWLVNLTGELGKWIEADLMQEHYNRWLEDMAEKMGGEFDDKFYRHTLSPNVQHFLRIKEEIESAFDVKSRSKAHGSAHLRDELQSLLRMYMEDELHRFRAGRSMGHAAVNTFNRGYERLEEGRVKSFLKQSLAYAQIVKDVKSAAEGGLPESRVGDEPETEVQNEEMGEDSDDGEEDDDIAMQCRPTPGQETFVDVQSGVMRINVAGDMETDSGSEEDDSGSGSDCSD
ncbi:hypothetical protein FPV67DRAFT_1678179 [Lyophyllum atratum]|nr:hypothetical protein FPV67DRAFT_1678179 [Lyophyllum atratum]